MIPQKKLEINGNLSLHPLAELLVEMTEASLSGSFRLANGERKIIIYLNHGKVVFAVSNLREHRLFSILLKENKISRQQLAALPNAANDMELSADLAAKNLVSKEDTDKLIARQIKEIIKFCLAWDTGEWTFSSLARIREGIRFEIDLDEMLLDFSRNLSPERISMRFSGGESFGIKPDSPFHLDLQSHEAFVLSRFENSFLTLGEIDTLSGLPELRTRQVLYSLWLGGFLYRQNWQRVLSDNKISSLLGANLQRVAQAPAAGVNAGETLPEAAETADAPEVAPAAEEEAEITEADERTLLRDYLERIENAENLYEVIGVEIEAETPEIKKSYFAQAKKYHPDLFHKNPEIHPRIQHAFTKLAQSYETLKTKETRDLYDYKMRKELAELRERQKSGISGEETAKNSQVENAAENFQWGMNLLREDEFDEAVPFFARAVHFEGNNALYRAYYGKALSFDKKNLHKAEAELQSAVKIEPENAAYRLMLVELFMRIGLKKRAEGELNRLLAFAPDNRDALALLDSLQGK